MTISRESNEGQRPISPIQRRNQFRSLFLERLRRSNELRNMYGNELTIDARALIDRALYSSYRDCVGLGARRQAREILGLPQN